MSWELIGVTLQTKERWGIDLKSPNAVPLILFTLMIYSGYKMTVEWLQCNLERRQNKAARVDYLVTHLIAVLALAISIIQYLARIQIVDVLSQHGSSMKMTAFLVGSLILGIIALVIGFHGHTKLRLIFVTASLILILMIPSAVAFLAGTKRWGILTSSIIVILVLVFGYMGFSTDQSDQGPYKKN